MSRFDDEIAHTEADILGVFGDEKGSAVALLALINVTARMARAQDFPLSFLHGLIDDHRPPDWPKG